MKGKRLVAERSLPTRGQGWEKGLTPGRMRELFKVMKIIYILIVMVVVICQNSSNCILKIDQFYCM